MIVITVILIINNDINGVVLFKTYPLQSDKEHLAVLYCSYLTYSFSLVIRLYVTCTMVRNNWPWWCIILHIILLLQVTDVSDAAHIMLKRYPQLCNTSYSSDSPVSKPVFVQLMVVDRYQPNHHKGLINVEYNSDDQLNITLLQVPEEPECSEKPSASVAPGTLFLVTYHNHCTK